MKVTHIISETKQVTLQPLGFFVAIYKHLTSPTLDDASAAVAHSDWLISGGVAVCAPVSQNKSVIATRKDPYISCQHPNSRKWTQDYNFVFRSLFFYSILFKLFFWGFFYKCILK